MNAKFIRTFRLLIFEDASTRGNIALYVHLHILDSHCVQMHVHGWQDPCVPFKRTHTHICMRGGLTYARSDFNKHFVHVSARVLMHVCMSLHSSHIINVMARLCIDLVSIFASEAIVAR